MATCIIIVGFAELQSTRQLFLFALTISIIFLFLFERHSLPKNNFADIDNNTHLLLDEFSQLLKNVNSTILHDLDILKKELIQINEVTKDASQKLTNNFYTLNEYITDQKKSIDSLLNSTDDYGNKHNRNDIHQINDKIQELNLSVIRLLQFEDIVSQISNSGLQYVSNIESFLSYINVLFENSINNLSHTKNLNIIDKTTKELSNINLRVLEKNIHPIGKSTKQMDMSEGSIELF